MDDTELAALLSRIDQAIGLLQMSDREVSLKATGKPDAIREIRRGKWPSDRRLRQIAAALETTAPYLLTGEGDHRATYLQHLPPAKLAEMEGVDGLPRDIPVFGVENISFRRNNNPYQVSLSSPLRFACRPPVLRNREDVYCLIMPDWSLAPRYDAGDDLYVDPRRLPGIGDYVVVRFADEKDAFSPEWSILVRKLVGLTGDTIEVERHDTAERQPYSIDDVWMLQRVIPWNELLAY